MWKFISICLLVGSVVGTPLKFDNSATSFSNEDLAARYLLSGIVKPTNYDVILFIDPNDDTGFRGSVVIRVVPSESVNEITLHAMEMEVENVVVNSPTLESTNLYSSHQLITDDRQFLIISLNNNMTRNAPYNISMDFKGKYAENMFGLYISTYEYEGRTRRLVTSQLQPTFARRAFPCFDEPHMKAKFTTTIYAPSEFNVVRSNMPLREDLQKPEVPGYVKHEFEDTVIMSSYILAYLVSDFEYSSNEENMVFNKPFKVFSRPGTLEFGEFAMKFGQDNMNALQEWTEFDYALPKLDNVAVPDFAAGAMENWGLIIYREVALLYQKGVTSTSTLQGIARIITHENMHMWFGNEVSPRSWTYLWLNEGFANYFESFGTDMVLPEWRMLDQYVISMQNVFQADAVLGVNPMIYPVFTPSQILGTFNAVAYQKSGSVIRMMRHFMTPPVFQRGLIDFLESNTREAATPEDLYISLQRALDDSGQQLGIPIATIMDRWTNQGGFPVITVRRSAPAAASVFITQERYLTDRSQNSSYQWHIPVNWVLSTDRKEAFEDTSPQRWLYPSATTTAIDILELPKADWFIFNKQQTGYYRVNYDVENWIQISRTLRNREVPLDTIHLLNRAQLIDDALNLARNGRLGYQRALDLILYIERELDYIPWAAANAGFAYLDNVLSGTSVYGHLKTILLRLSESTYNTLGFNATENEEHVTAFHRNIILSLNCRYGNEHCINTAASMLQDTNLNPDIQTVVYCSSLRGGSVDNFNYLWNKFTGTTDSGQQSIYLNALGCTSNPERRTFYLNQAIQEDSPVREQDSDTVFVSVINASPENRDAALDFIIENFLKIQERVQGLTGTTNILNALSRTLTSQQHLNKINEFREKYKEHFSAGEIASIDGIIENIGASIAWTNDYYSEVDVWLRTNNAVTFTATFTILITLISAFINLYL